MKFSKTSQLFLVSSIGLLVATLLTACSLTTVDYVYVASSSGIQIFAVDSQSGALRTGADTVTTGLSSPVAMATTSDYANLYVANKGNNTVVHYAIGLHGELTVKDTLTLGSTPVALATDTAGTYLYVVASGSTATLTEYALSSGTIGSETAQEALSAPGYASDTIIPTGVSVLVNTETVSGNAVYVTAYDQSAYNPGGTTTSDNSAPGYVYGYTIGSGGTLTATTNSPYAAGIKPTAIAAEPTNYYLYVTDYASNQLIGYSIMGGNRLSYLTAGPFKTGNEPSAIAIDPRGKFIYVTNFLDFSVTAYAITQATGAPTVANNVTGNSSNSTDTEPVAIAVDPALGRFVYTANYLGNSVSGFRLDAASGALTATQSTPYSTGSEPTAVVIIPHGNHATQSITQ
jgi:6-phosphogluconolactonase (cycloisomerase 2 family)